MIRHAPLIDAFGRQATYGARQWFGRVGNRFAGITLLGKGEGGGVLKAYYASGREIPEFDSAGARNWKYHTSDDGVEVGPPELIPGLPGFKTKGRSWVEWLVPAELSEGSDEPEDILWIVNGLKVHDYTYSGGLLVQGAKIVSANNALVALFIATQRMGLPLTRLHRWGQSWIDFKTRCAETIPFAAGSGLLGQYYSDATLTTLVHTRNEPYLDRDWDHVSPAPDVPAAPFSARFTGKVKPTHTGDWTFYARYDDGCRVTVNGVQLVNDWAAGAMRETSGTITLTANVEYDIVVEYFQQEALGGLHLSWSHASVPKAVVPQGRLIPPSRTVERYSAHVAFPSNTPALVAFNSVFRRAPGCTWQDVNGALRVLTTPDRAVTHKFTYDPTQTLLRPNILDGSFSLKPRPREDRPDYLIVSYEDADDPFFTTRTVAADRRADPTKPPKNPIGPIPVGVATHSLASRIAETEMNVVHSLSYYVRLSGFADSHKVARGDVVEYSHDVTGVRETAPVKLFVTEEKFLAPRQTADDRSFLARLHDPNWYSDAGYVPMSIRIVSDLPSPYVPPPPVTSVTLNKFDRFLPDNTHVPVVQGSVQFAPFAHPQRGRVYWKRPRKAFTFDAGTDTFTAAAHGMPNGTKVELFNTGGTLPVGFSAATAYYVVNQAQNTFQLAATPGGAAIDGTSAGTGTHEIREFDFAATNIVVTPDPVTLLGAFEVENVPLGVNDFKVVTESLKGVSRGVASATAYTFTVVALPLPPDLTLLPYSEQGGVIEIAWNALDLALYPDFVRYEVYDGSNNLLWQGQQSSWKHDRRADTTLTAPQTVTYKVKAVLRGNRRSANFAVLSVAIQARLVPAVEWANQQPQSVVLTSGPLADPFKSGDIKSMEYEVTDAATSAVLYTEAVPYDNSLLASVGVSIHAAKSRVASVNVRARYYSHYQFFPPSDWSVTLSHSFATLGSADVGTGTPSSGKVLAATGSSTNPAEWRPLASSDLPAHVSSITGTANQVVASQPTGAVTLSLPQNVHSGATPQFSRLGLGNAAHPTLLLDAGGAGRVGQIVFARGFASVGKGGYIFGGTGAAGAVDIELGLFVANDGTTGGATDGPYLLARGNAFSRSVNQRGAMFFSTGSVSTPAGNDGVLSFDSPVSFIDLATGGVSRIRILNSGSVGVGATDPGERLDVAGRLKLRDTTAPGAAADCVVIWSESVGGSSELRVRDEAGNVTTLSPHAQDAPAWMYDAEDVMPPRLSREVNAFAGTVRFTNHTRAARLQQMLFDGRLVSALAPDKRRIVHEETFAEYNARMGFAEGSAGRLRAEDWDEAQEAAHALREAERARWAERRDAHEAAVAEFQRRRAALLEWMALPIHLKAETPRPESPGWPPAPFAEAEPPVYEKKPAPAWLKR